MQLRMRRSSPSAETHEAEHAQGNIILEKHSRTLRHSTKSRFAVGGAYFFISTTPALSGVM